MTVLSSAQVQAVVEGQISTHARESLVSLLRFLDPSDLWQLQQYAAANATNAMATRSWTDCGVELAVHQVLKEALEAHGRRCAS